MTGSYERCGRLTQKKTPCQMGRSHLRQSDPFGWTPPACGLHLTREELEEMYEIERAWPERKREAGRIENERILAEAKTRPEIFGSSCTQEDCSKHILPWPVSIQIPDPRSCHAHMTSDERAAYDTAMAAVHVNFARLAREPDCWSWPEPASRVYGTEDDAAQALSQFQLGRGCAICGDAWPLVEDHDHETGLVRGNLCRSCNRREGEGNDTPPFLKYRARNPASILGVKIQYYSPWSGYAEPQEPDTAEDRAARKAAVEKLSHRLPSPESLRDEEPLPQEASET